MVPSSFAGLLYFLQNILSKKQMWKHIFAQRSSQSTSNFNAFVFFYIKRVAEKFETEQFLVDPISHVHVWSKSDTRKLSTLVVASFSDRTYISEPK